MTPAVPRDAARHEELVPALRLIPEHHAADLVEAR